MAAATLLLVVSVTLLHALSILSVSLAFHAVKVDNLTYAFGAVFDAARWPASVFRGVLRVLFTYVVPLAVMTTFPAEALLGRGSVGQLAGGVLAATVALVVSRLVWSRAVAKYTSASS